MSRKKYSTDIAKSQWDYVKKIIPQPKRLTKRNIDRKEILNAVLYIVRTGCQWRNLPHDFPKWTSVYNVFYQWRNDGTWKIIHDYLVHKIRVAVGKKPKPTAGIIDSQSAKNDAGVCQETGYDAGKKVKGRKRHIVTDTLGLLQNVKVHSADLLVLVFGGVVEEFIEFVGGQQSLEDGSQTNGGGGVLDEGFEFFSEMKHGGLLSVQGGMNLILQVRKPPCYH